MTINDQIRDEKLQYDINREAAKISALSSDKTHKFEYLTGKDILPSDKQQIIEQAKFTYSPLGKAFEKQIKTVEDQGQKQVKALNTFKSDNKKSKIDNVIPKNALKNDDKALKKLNKIKEVEKTVDREKLIYWASEYTYDFRNFQTIRTFGRDIYEGNVTLDEASIEQDNLLEDIKNFSSRTRPQNNMKIQEKRIVLKKVLYLLAKSF